MYALTIPKTTKNNSSMIKGFIITQMVLFGYAAASNETLLDWGQYGLGALVIAALFHYVLKPVMTAFTDHIKRSAEASFKTAEAIENLTKVTSELVTKQSQVASLLKELNSKINN